MDAQTTWGMVFLIYVLSGIYPLIASGVDSGQGKLSDAQYRAKFERDFWKRNYPMLIWSIGMGVLIFAWKYTSKSEINSLGIVSICLVGAAIISVLAWLFHRQFLAAPKKSSTGQDELGSRVMLGKIAGGSSMQFPNFNIWQRGVFGVGALIVATMIFGQWSHYDDKVPALGIALGVALAALAVSPKKMP